MNILGCWQISDELGIPVDEYLCLAMLFQDLHKQTVDLLSDAIQDYPFSNSGSETIAHGNSCQTNESTSIVGSTDVRQLLSIYNSIYDKEVDAAKSGLDEVDPRVALLVKCTSKRTGLQEQCERCMKVPIE